MIQMQIMPIHRRSDSANARPMKSHEINDISSIVMSWPSIELHSIGHGHVMN